MASGSLDAAFSSIWRIVVNTGDVYLAPAKAVMGVLKVSLHASGVWVIATTKQSGATFQGGNRRAKRWNRPVENAPGITRGPSILIPHTSLGARKVIPGEADKKVHWYKAPLAGETVDFSLYFVEPGVTTAWPEEETVIGMHPLPGERQLLVLAAARPSPAPFLSAVESLLRENVFTTKDLSAFEGGSFVWTTESVDKWKIPLLVDLPIPLKATV